MYTIGTCKKCEIKIVFDFTGFTIEEAKTIMASADMGECPGMHVEIGKMADYYDVDWTKLFNTIKEATDYKDALIA